MTAEVCIMNRLGLALAADSAVTMTYPGGSKIYQSAEKLFQLSEVDPVAVMIYGSAVLLDVPWETIIKRFRAKHGRESRPTLRDHADTLMGFLRSNREFFPAEREKRELLRITRIYLHLVILKELQDRLKREISHAGPITEPQIITCLEQVMDESEAKLAKLPRDPDFPADFDETVKKECRREFDEAIDATFERLRFSTAIRDRLVRLSLSFFLRGRLQGSSGLVVAGFGDAEVFPSLANEQLDTILLGHVKAPKRQIVAVNDGGGSCVIPFAQTEMVETFMEGIDPSLREYVSTSLESAFDRLPQVIMETLGGSQTSLSDNVKAALTDSMKDMLGGLIKTWKSFQDERHVRPIMSAVGVLPKDELASMAEALVNLTVLRRRTSTDQETVGGPIDVAVVTKGDGFVWIKRKHYFDAKLNPRYVSKFLGRG